MRVIVCLCAGFLLPLFAQHEQDGKKGKNPFADDPKAVQEGQKLFAGGCAACHGADGQGGRGPNLRERVFWHPLDEETLFNAVQKGIPGGMPPANLPEDQAWKVVSYVRSLTAPAIENTVAGDVRAGEELFWSKGNCGNCHRIRGRGGMLGPDLSNVAAVRAVPQIRDAIVDPDADGTANYRGVSVVLGNGKTLRGVARNRTNYSLQLQDAQGQLHMLQLKDVKEVTLSKGSPMPKDYAKKFSRQEIDNLVAFLSRQSMRPAEPGEKKGTGN